MEGNSDKCHHQLRGSATRCLINVSAPPSFPTQTAHFSRRATPHYQRRPRWGHNGLSHSALTEHRSPICQESRRYEENVMRNHAARTHLSGRPRIYAVRQQYRSEYQPHIELHLADHHQIWIALGPETVAQEEARILSSRTRDDLGT